MTAMNSEEKCIPHDKDFKWVLMCLPAQHVHFITKSSMSESNITGHKDEAIK